MTTNTNIIPTNLGKAATLHVEAIVNGRQIGIAIVDGMLIQCADGKWSTQAPRPGMTVEQAANGAAEMLLARGGVKFA